MGPLPVKVANRLIAGIKKFQPILNNAKSRDVNEADTVIIVTDMLNEVFGYDKYKEITSEFSIRSTYCDLAIKLDGKLEYLIEVKAIGLELKENHVKQAVDYAANVGTDFVVLTNGNNWKVFKIAFNKPIEQELVLDIDFLKLNPRKNEDVEKISLISKEPWMKSSLYEYHSQKQALSKYFLSAIILNDPVIDAIRRELRKIVPDVRVSAEQIKEVISMEVLKREVIEGEKADEAQKKVLKKLNKISKTKMQKPNNVPNEDNTETSESNESENQVLFEETVQ